MPLKEELDNLKTSIQTSLSLLPPNSLVGIITFGKMVQLHELDQNSPIPKSYVFRGTKDISSKQLKEMLQLGRSVTPHQNMQEQQMQQGSICKFLQPIGQIELYLNTLIDEIQIDPWPVPPKKRPSRCTGVALSIACGLLESTYPNCSARIITFLAGPATVGPGTVIDTDRANTMRTWHTIDKDNATFVKKAIKHYKNIAVRAASAGHAIDLFAGCLDQTGLHEMKTLCTSTGGHLVMCDSFSSSLFSHTYKKMFKTENDQFEMGFNATLEVKTSRELKLQGIIGSCVSLNVKAPHVAEEEIGVGGTSQYRICAIDPNTTYGVYLQVANPSNNPLPSNSNGFIQFSTNYIHSDGTRRVRVTTIARPFADPSDANSLTSGFDQEAAAVLMARYASYRCERDEPPTDIIRWLDRTLIRLCQKFGRYNTGNMESFKFPVTMSNFPQFMFHLRRTQFLNVFGHSPDETAYARYQLCKQNMTECITMIQPQLYRYSFDGPPDTVHLDSTSILPNAILLLDSFFQVLIFHGKDIDSWIKQGYHEKPEYENLKKLIEAPVEDAREVIEGRFPVPRYIETQEGGSQARFLYSKVNVSKSHNTQDWDQSGGATVLSDDISLQKFVDHLKKLAVKECVEENITSFTQDFSNKLQKMKENFK